MKQLFCFVMMTLCVAILFTTLTASALANQTENEQTPDLAIGSKEELIEFANRVNGGETFEDKLVVLTADIDLENMAWTPIGYDSYGTSPENAVSFNGTFDGRGHTISNLTDSGYVPTITTYGEYGFGLFGYAYGANFKNINLENVSIYADGLAEGDGAGVAALVGYYRIKSGAPFVFENCHLKSGSIYATNNMGGLVGYMLGEESSTILLDGRFVGCTNSATVTAKKREAGGIVGLFDMVASGSLKVYGDLLFQDCKNYGTITAEASNAGNSCAGGILGRDNTGALWYFGGRIVFDGCYNNGTITAYGNDGDEIHASGMGTVYNVGGMTAAVKNCTNEGSVSTVGSDVAFCGEILACSGYAMIENCTVTDYSKLYGGVSRMLFVEQPGVEINNNARALLYLNGAAAPKTLTFGQSGGQEEKNIVAKDNYFFDGWFTSPDFSGSPVTFNNGGNDSGVFYAKFITLEEAYANVEEGGTLTFGSNISDAALVIDKDITIDLSGYTYEITAGIARTQVQGLQLLAGNDVTIKNGTISSDVVSTLIDNYANLTLENVTLDGVQLQGDKQTLVVKSGATTLKNSTVNAADDGVAINVCDVESYENASLSIDTSTITGMIELTDSDGDEFTGKLMSGSEEITEPGSYVQYNDVVFLRIDKYALELTVDKTKMHANDTLTATVSIDKDYYSAEYTFTYDVSKFSCAEDTDNDGVIFVTNLYEGAAADLATYTLVAKNNINSVSTDNIISVDGNVIQYKEQLLNKIENVVVGDTESITISLDYTAEVKVDYVQGYSLVLVKGADAAYAYNGVTMFYVEAYEANAFIVEGVVTEDIIDAALSKASESKTISPSYNINAEYVDDGKIDLKDATTVYACSAIDFAVNEYMDLYLLSDVNGDFVVNMIDINAVTENYTE